MNESICVSFHDSENLGAFDRATKAAGRRAAPSLISLIYSELLTFKLLKIATIWDLALDASNIGLHKFHLSIVRIMMSPFDPSFF
jgi:hypothetical protein